jgi:hypothetical protein
LLATLFHVVCRAFREMVLLLSMYLAWLTAHGSADELAPHFSVSSTMIKERMSI